MTLTKKINRLIETIFVMSLTLICLFLSQRSLIFVGMIPIIFAIFYFNEGIISLLTGIFGTYFMGLVFVDSDTLFMNLLPLIFSSIGLIVVIGLKLSDRAEILSSFIISSLIFIFIYKYKMYVDNTTIDDLAVNLKANFESIYPYTLDLDLYRFTSSLYPALLAWVSMFYSILSVKLVRNYLAYKSDSYTDIKNLDQLRINIKDLIILLIIELVIFYLGKFLGIKDIYLLGNLVLLTMMFFAVNGVSLFDYILKNSTIPLTRGFQWFFIVILIQIFLIPLIILGILDVFIDFRARRKNEK